MISLLLLIADSSLSAARPAAITWAQASMGHDQELHRSAIQTAVERGLLGRGYFQMITTNSEQVFARKSFEKRLREVGIPASVGACHWIGLVSAGTARGNRSFGGACRVRINGRAPEDFLICEASLGSVTLIHPDTFGWAPDYVELFIRRTCL